MNKNLKKLESMFAVAVFTTLQKMLQTLKLFLWSWWIQTSVTRM